MAILNTMFSSQGVSASSAGSTTTLYIDKDDDNYGIGEGLTFHADAEDNIAIGENALNSTSGAALQNIAIGTNALTTVNAGDYNIAIGLGAGKLLEGGAANTILGTSAGDAFDDESHNTIIGYSAAGGALSANDLVVIGASALVGAATQDGTVAIGRNALYALTGGDGNVAIGKSALAGINDGLRNTVIGYEAMLTANGDEHNNVAIGYKAMTLMDNNDAEQNVAVGSLAMSAITDGEGTGVRDSVAIGYNAFVGASTTHQTASGTVAIGSSALTGLTTGTGNTAVGYQAGNVLTSGAENTIIGYDCDVASDDNTNNIIIGNNLTGTDKDNAVFIGNDTNHIENDFNADATWNYSSDIRQKKDIKDDILGLSFIKDLRPVTYKHKSPSEFPEEWTAYNPDDKEPMGGDKVIHGLIAQEVKQALDNQGIDTFGGWSAGDDGRQRISAEKMIMPLIKAVQELSAQVEELKNK